MSERPKDVIEWDGWAVFDHDNVVVFLEKTRAAARKKAIYRGDRVRKVYLTTLDE